MATLTREDMIIQSVEDMLRDHLFSDLQLPTTEVILKDAFDYEHFDEQPLDKNYVCLGFNFDDGGKRAEMGSNLMIKVHHIEVWVFAQTPALGQNIAAQVQQAWAMENFLVPLKDYAQDGDPVVDFLIVEDAPGPRSARQPHPDPRPWQQNAWTVTARVTDEYYGDEA